MVMTFLVVLVIALFFNWYTVLFGRKDLEQLKAKISIGKYLKEINEALESSLGRKGAAVTKVVLFLVAIAILVSNALLFLAGFVGLVIGTMLAKKSFKISAVSNVLNKIATYINRIR